MNDENQKLREERLRVMSLGQRLEQDKMLKQMRAEYPSLSTVDSFQNEHRFNRWFSECLLMCNACVWACVGDGFQEPGWPDRFFAHSRVPGGCWVEGKKDKGKLSTKQELVCRDLIDRGTNVVVAHYSKSYHGYIIRNAKTLEGVAAGLVMNNKASGEQGVMFLEAVMLTLGLSLDANEIL